MSHDDPLTTDMVVAAGFVPSVSDRLSYVHVLGSKPPESTDLLRWFPEFRHEEYPSDGKPVSVLRWFRRKPYASVAIYNPTVTEFRLVMALRSQRLAT